MRFFLYKLSFPYIFSNYCIIIIVLVVVVIINQTSPCPCADPVIVNAKAFFSPSFSPLKLYHNRACLIHCCIDSAALSSRFCSVARLGGYPPD